MSIAALNWAWHQECPNATSKLVLLALADKANEDGECWPGMGTVAAMAGISARQVSTHLGRLEDAGLLSRSRARRDNGTMSGYRYHLNVQQKDASTGSAPPVEADRHRKRATSGSGASSPPEVQRRNHRKPASAQEPPVNPQGTLAPDRPARKPRPPDPIFDALVHVCGIDPAELTKSARSAVNSAVKQLRDIGATGEEIHRRARRHRKQWPDATLTPTSLAKHYAQLGATAAGASPPNGTPPVYGSPEWEARQRDLEQRAAQLTGG